MRINLNTYLFCYFSQVGIHLGKRNKHPYVEINCYKHLRRNSFKASLGITLLPNKVQPQDKLNNRSKRWLILKYSFLTKTPFKSKITCKGLTFTFYVSIGRGDLKPPRARLFPLFFLCKFMENSMKCIIFGPNESQKGRMWPCWNRWLKGRMWPGWD